MKGGTRRARTGDDAVPGMSASADTEPKGHEPTIVSPAQWRSRPMRELLNELGAEPKRGLSPAEASDRLKRYGPNELRKEADVRPLAVLVAQFQSVIIWVLIGA